jgi:hypothetical protein
MMSQTKPSVNWFLKITLLIVQMPENRPKITIFRGNYDWYLTNKKTTTDLYALVMMSQ